MVIDRNIREEVGKFGQKVMNCRVFLFIFLGVLGCCV